MSEFCYWFVCLSEQPKHYCILVFRDNAAVVEVLLRYGFDVNRKSTQPLDLYLESFDYVSKFRAGSTPIYIATVAGGCILFTFFSSGGEPVLAVPNYTALMIFRVPKHGNRSCCRHINHVLLSSFPCSYLFNLPQTW